jgi:ubiquinone/menaquinone biosynthesis C-methylase UbiE
VSSRSQELELIDLDPPQGEALRRVLAELALVNRWLGGTNASIAALRERFGDPGRISILDVGAGGGDLFRALPKPSIGPAPLHVASDVSPEACRIALEAAAPDESAVRFAAADAFRLPFADRSFDVVHCSLFLHHIPEQRIPAFLGELLRVAREGVLINDLHRHRVAEVLIRILSALFSRSRYFRHDAPASVRRAFKRSELEAMIAAARGCGEIRWRWAFRYLVWIATC